MPRKQKQYHFIYKTTNVLTNKFYVGMHSTDDLEDGYFGSGKRLWYSIRKYGKENHKCEIVEFCSSREELKNREAEIVNEELLLDSMCMNLKLGGEGGGGFWNDAHEIAFRKASSEATKRRLMENGHHPNSLAALRKNKKNIEYSWFGKFHSEETKQKMSISSIRQNIL